MSFSPHGRVCTGTKTTRGWTGGDSALHSTPAPQYNTQKHMLFFLCGGEKNNTLKTFFSCQGNKNRNSSENWLTLSKKVKVDTQYCSLFYLAIRSFMLLVCDSEGRWWTHWPVVRLTSLSFTMCLYVSYLPSFFSSFPPSLPSFLNQIIQGSDHPRW